MQSGPMLVPGSQSPAAESNFPPANHFVGHSKQKTFMARAWDKISPSGNDPLFVPTMKASRTFIGKTLEIQNSHLETESKIKDKTLSFKERYNLATVNVARVTGAIADIAGASTLEPLAEAMGGTQKEIFNSATKAGASVYHAIAKENTSNPFQKLGGAIVGGLTFLFVILLREAAYLISKPLIGARILLNLGLAGANALISLIVAGSVHLAVMHKKFLAGLGISTGVAAVLGGIAAALIVTGAIAFFATPAGWAVLGAIGGVAAVAALVLAIRAGVKGIANWFLHTMDQRVLAGKSSQDIVKDDASIEAAYASDFNKKDGEGARKLINERFFGTENPPTNLNLDEILAAVLEYQPDCEDKNDIQIVRGMHFVRLMLENHLNSERLEKYNSARLEKYIYVLSHAGFGQSGQPLALTDTQLVGLHDYIMAGNSKTLKKFLLIAKSTCNSLLSTASAKTKNAILVARQKYADIAAMRKNDAFLNSKFGKNAHTLDNNALIEAYNSFLNAQYDAANKALEAQRKQLDAKKAKVENHRIKQEKEAKKLAEKRHAEEQNAVARAKKAQEAQVRKASKKDPDTQSFGTYTMLPAEQQMDNNAYASSATQYLNQEAFAQQTGRYGYDATI